MASLEQIQKNFLSSAQFAVVGASKDQKKFGTRVLKWYQARDLKVTPVHPVRLILMIHVEQKSKKWMSFGDSSPLR